jgi:hypothetical protein
MLLIPVMGINVITNTGNANNAIKTSGDYQLSDMASLEALTVIDHEYVYQERNADGPGKNKIKESVSGDQYSITNTVDSSGKMSSSSTTVASSDIGAVNTDTDLYGQFGSIGMIANSKKNLFIVEGRHYGEGDLKADLQSVASDSAMTTGTASMLGMQCFSDDISGMMASGSSAIGVNAVYITPDENLGEFQMTALNLEKSAKMPSQSKSAPALSDPDPSDLNEYSLTGYMLPNAIPIIIAPNDANKAKMPTGADAEIITATNTWETAYGDSTKFFSSVTLDPTAKVRDVPVRYTGVYNLYDGKNLHGWSNDPQIFTQPNIIAVTWTRWDTTKPLTGADGKSYNSMAESDCYYNGKLTWYKSTTDTGYISRKYDIQTIALHELGHTIGLYDLYNSAASDEVMYGYYNGVKRTPHTGDVAGLFAKYGTPGTTP